MEEDEAGDDDRGVSENSSTSKSSILIGFSIINYPFWGTPIFGNTHRGQGECGSCMGGNEEGKV